MNPITSYIIQAILLFCSATFLFMIGKYVVPWLTTHSKSVDWTTTLSQLKLFIDAAEAKFLGSGLGPTKKAWVITLVQGLGICIDSAISAAIDGIVKEKNDAANLTAIQINQIPALASVALASAPNMLRVLIAPENMTSYYAQIPADSLPTPETVTK